MFTYGTCQEDVELQHDSVVTKAISRVLEKRPEIVRKELIED